MKFKSGIILNYLAVGVGGALGSVSRGLLGWYTESLVALFIANIGGCLLYGFFLRMLQRRFSLSRRLNEFLVAGFCGGLTSFSTLMLLSIGYAFDLSDSLYFFVSILVGMIAASLGATIAEKTIKFE